MKYDWCDILATIGFILMSFSVIGKFVDVLYNHLH